MMGAMLKFKSVIVASLSLCLPVGFIHADNFKVRDDQLVIDNEVWTIKLESDACEARVPIAIEAYWRAPLYDMRRMATRQNFLVNSTLDCWIEIAFDGLDHDTIIYKVSKENTILDRRRLRFRMPRVRPFPDGPVYPY
jgi:hypothetical protein